jgi:hypothetical protein
MNPIEIKSLVEAAVQRGWATRRPMTTTPGNLTRERWKLMGLTVRGTPRKYKVRRP